MKKLVFVDTINKKWLKEINRETVIIAMNDEVGKRLGRFGLEFKTLLDYKVSVNIDKNLAKIIRGWWNKNFEDGNNFNNSFIYENLSISWILEEWVFGHTPYSESIINVFELVELINKAISKERPGKIILMSNDRGKRSIFLQLKNKHDIRIISGISIVFKEADLRRRLIFFLAQNRSIVRKFVWDLMKRSSRTEFKRYKILSFAAKNVKYLDAATGNVKYGNVAEAVFDKLDGKVNYEFKIVTYPPIFFGIRDMFRNGGKVKYLPIENYLNINDILEARKQHKIIYRKWVKNRRDERFQGLFNYKGINIWGFLVEDLDFFFSNLLSRILLEMNIYKRSLLRENPDLVVHDDFATSRGLELMTIARNFGVKNLAIQHGGAMIPHMTFIYTKKDVAKNIRPLSDIITAHGFYNKKFLIKNSRIFPRKIKVVGDPQYDLLDDIVKSFNKEVICDDLGLEKNKKTVLFAPSMSFSQLDKICVAESFFNAAKKLDFQIIVKFHPKERETFIYENEAKKSGIRNVIFLRNYDSLKLIYISDVVVSTFSSINLEAVLLGKPSIIIDVFNKKYHKYINSSKAIFNVTSDKRLYAILKLVYENSLRLDKHRNEFIKNFYYRLDGKACKRIGKIIKMMVE